jgi:hypothetical protein
VLLLVISPVLVERAPMVFQPSFRVGAAEPESGDADVRAQDPDERLGGEGVAVDQCPGRFPKAAVAGQGDAGRNINVEILCEDQVRAVQFDISRNEHCLAGLSFLESGGQLIDRAHPVISVRNHILVPFAASDGTALVGPGPVDFAADLDPGPARILRQFVP